MNFVHFSRRMKIEELFYEWCEAEGIAKKPNSMVVFLMEKGWLNEEQIIKVLADTPHTDKDKVVCPNCGRSDYIRSFEKDFNIKNSGYRYKCINCNTYIKDTPQTETHECERYVITNDEGEKAYGCMGCQTDCPWK